MGFRPFIYQLASRYNLTGYVTNTSQGVHVEVEGPGKDVERFFDAVVPERPPLAHIASLEWREIPPKKEAAFEIRISKAGEEKTALISPDVSICPDCLLELGDPQNRRFGYPFINCTNCGPRYTIIQDIPYDRDFTTMKAFQMCPACEREYHDPGNRRFHAQPNACRECGPGISLHNARAKKINCPDPIQEAIGLLEQGYILAVKGLGGFHLAVDASIHKAVVRLRRRKHREEKPLAMMVHDLAGARKVAHLDEVEAEILTSHQRPIVILRKRRFHGLSSQIAPKNTTFGIMLPYTPLHYLLMKGGFKALVMTSGNRTEEPIHINNDEAFKGLGDIADYFLVHSRDIYLRSDDSLVRVVDRQPRQIRRSRGFVPVPIFLPQEMSKLPSVLAVGGELKNTICLTKENRAFLSQHVGDMENLETLDFFHLTISHLKRILEIGPEVIAHDLHPDYLSTQYARQQRHLPIVAVQHHHAHIVSCLAEHGHNGPVIGLALDGTGYGADGRIWGGEVLLADLTSFKRAAHLETLPLPGGDGAARFPWRMALVYLDRAYGDGLFNLDLPYVRGLDKEQAVILLQMARQGVNAPHTSSCGRFFDAISALLGLRGEIAYEGQAAIELEMCRRSGEKGSYAWHMEREGDPKVMRTSGIVKGVVDDIIKGVGKGVISGRFHNTLINMFTESCILIREETHIDQVALSGGCFQNETLLTGLIRSLRAAGFAVLSHALIPANDGALALGQAVCGGLRYAGVKGRYEVKGPFKKEA